MVVPLGPGKFYGSSLPRPRFYTDVKLNEERVDPPLPVMEPFLSWAREAHWSMGGLRFDRVRLQGKIEGNISKLRKLSDNKVIRESKRRASRLASLRDEHEGEPLGDAVPPEATRTESESKRTGEEEELGKKKPVSPEEVSISPKRSSKRGKRKRRNEYSP